MTTVINKHIDLVFCDDPEETGWYFIDYRTWKVSDYYNTKQQALSAYKENKVNWQ